MGREAYFFISFVFMYFSISLFCLDKALSKVDGSCNISRAIIFELSTISLSLLVEKRVIQKFTLYQGIIRVSLVLTE